MEEHKKAYDRLIEVKESPVRGKQVYYKEDEIKAVRRYLRLKDTDLYKSYTMQQLLNRLDVFE